jgi:hypothetical protein
MLEPATNSFIFHISFSAAWGLSPGGGFVTSMLFSSYTGTGKKELLSPIHEIKL